MKTSWLEKFIDRDVQTTTSRVPYFSFKINYRHLPLKNKKKETSDGRKKKVPKIYSNPRIDSRVLWKRSVGPCRKKKKKHFVADGSANVAWLTESPVVFIRRFFTSLCRSAYLLKKPYCFQIGASLYQVIVYVWHRLRFSKEAYNLNRCMPHAMWVHS